MIASEEDIIRVMRTMGRPSAAQIQRALQEDGPGYIPIDRLRGQLNELHVRGVLGRHNIVDHGVSYVWWVLADGVVHERLVDVLQEQNDG